MSIILGIIILVVAVLAIRLLGSWMLRIDEVINVLYKIYNLLNDMKNEKR